MDTIIIYQVIDKNSRDRYTFNTSGGYKQIEELTNRNKDYAQGICFLQGES